MTLEKEFHGANLGYVLDLYEQYQNDPATVDKATRQFFEEQKSESLTSAALHALIGTINLAQAIRSHGYLAAQLDPLGNPPIDDPLLTLEFHHIQESDLIGLPASLVNFDNQREVIRDGIILCRPMPRNSYICSAPATVTLLHAV